MMVEAGGTEGSFEKYADGAPKVSEEVLSAGLEASKLWIRESINLQRELVQDFIAARGAITAMEYQTIADYQDDVYESVLAMGATSLSEANKLTTKTARNEALDAATASIIEHSEGRVPEPTERDQGGRSFGHQEDRASSHRRRGCAHRRTLDHRHPSALGRDRPLPDDARIRDVPAR